MVADCVCCVKSGEVLGRDGDAATATALKAIQDVESEEREAVRLREQKIAHKASFNEEYDTGERSDFTRGADLHAATFYTISWLYSMYCSF